MTELVLVRHGETIWHAENRYAGSTDVPLTPRGLRQAGRLAAWATTADLSALWCSSLTRAIETAKHVADATGLTAKIDVRLAELDFGEAEGLTTADMKHRFGHRLTEFHANPVTHYLPGGEDPRHAADRATACIRDIAAEVPGGRVLVIAHNTLIRLCLCQLLGIPLANYRRVFPSVANGALTTLRLADGYTSLLQFNTPLNTLEPAH